MAHILVFQIIWWVVFFILLPIGVRILPDTVVGHVPSAPVHPQLKKKLIGATLVSLVLWACVWAVIDSGVLDDWMRGGL